MGKNGLRSNLQILQRQFMITLVLIHIYFYAGTLFHNIFPYKRRHFNVTPFSIWYATVTIGLTSQISQIIRYINKQWLFDYFAIFLKFYKMCLLLIKHLSFSIFLKSSSWENFQTVFSLLFCFDMC